MPMFTQADLSLWEQECELVLNASEYEAYLDQLEAKDAAVRALLAK